MNEELIIKVATKTSIGGALTSGFGALTLTDWLSVGGFIIAVIAAGVSIYFSFKDDRRKELEHKLRLRDMPSDVTESRTTVKTVTKKY